MLTFKALFKRNYVSNVPKILVERVRCFFDLILTQKMTFIIFYLHDICSIYPIYVTG